MSQYRVAAGIHFQEGKKYKKGDLVESTQDLVTLFPEKFTKVEGAVGAKPAAKVKGWEDDDEASEGAEEGEHKHRTAHVTHATEGEGEEHKHKTLPKATTQHRTMRDNR